MNRADGFSALGSGHPASATASPKQVVTPPGRGRDVNTTPPPKEHSDA